jgi:hypothetical protein
MGSPARFCRNRGSHPFAGAGIGQRPWRQMSARSNIGGSRRSRALQGYRFAVRVAAKSVLVIGSDGGIGAHTRQDELGASCTPLPAADLTESAIFLYGLVVLGMRASTDPECGGGQPSAHNFHTHK